MMGLGAAYRHEPVYRFSLRDKADINRPTIAAELVENDPLPTSGHGDPAEPIPLFCGPHEVRCGVTGFKQRA